MAPQHVVAVDLGGTKLAIALVDRNGGRTRQRSIPVDGRSSLAPMNQIVELTQELLQHKEVKRKIAAVGVAVPGLVRRDGTVWAPNLTGWTRMPLAHRLRSALGVPVVVESDRNAAVLGETWRGAAKGKSDVIVLMLGTGIGAGILSGERLVRGAHELAGCAGWMVVTDKYGPKAWKVGQLESLAAGPAIAQAAKNLVQKSSPSRLVNAFEVAEAARQGDRAAIKIYLEAGRLLGYGVANLVSLFDPEIVVIGGGLARASGLFLQALRQSMKERAQPVSGRQVRVVVSKLGENVNLLGVARLAGVAFAHWYRGSATQGAPPH